MSPFGPRKHDLSPSESQLWGSAAGNDDAVRVLIMSQTIVRPFAGADQLNLAAAAEFVRCAQEAQLARGRFTVALSGGSTPRRLFQILAAPPFRDQVKWPQVEFFWGDERSVPPDHPDSNYRMAREA